MYCDWKPYESVQIRNPRNVDFSSAELKENILEEKP